MEVGRIEWGTAMDEQTFRNLRKQLPSAANTNSLLLIASGLFAVAGYIAFAVAYRGGLFDD